MSADYKFNFFVVQVAVDIWDVKERKNRFYGKPCFVDEASRAFMFKTYRNAYNTAKQYENLGFEAKVLKFEAKTTTLTGEEKK